MIFSVRLLLNSRMKSTGCRRRYLKRNKTWQYQTVQPPRLYTWSLQDDSFSQLFLVWSERWILSSAFRKRPGKTDKSWFLLKLRTYLSWWNSAGFPVSLWKQKLWTASAFSSASVGCLRNVCAVINAACELRHVETRRWRAALRRRSHWYLKLTFCTTLSSFCSLKGKVQTELEHKVIWYFTKNRSAFSSFPLKVQSVNTSTVEMSFILKVFSSSAEFMILRLLTPTFPQSVITMFMWGSNLQPCDQCTARSACLFSWHQCHLFIYVFLYLYDWLFLTAVEHKSAAAAPFMLMDG